MPRFGKHPPRVDYRTLRLGKYLLPALPPPPPACDNLARVCKNLGVSDPATLFPMDGNDQWGDCAVAGVAHAIAVYRGMVGAEYVIPSDAVVSLYFRLTGGVDSGLAALDVLNYWRRHPVGSAVPTPYRVRKAAGDEVLAFVSVNPGNHDHVRQAISLFGGAYVGFQVPDNCLDLFNARQPWVPGNLTNDGHAVFVPSYDAEYLTALTWGSTQLGTWGWWDECVDECYAILPPEARSASFDLGLDLAQLLADLGQVAG